jgi:hypothetical protein
VPVGTGEKQYPPNILQAAFGVRLDISIQREQQPSCCSAIPFSLRVTRRRRKLTIASPAPKLFTRRRRRLRLLPRHPRRLVVNTNALQRSNRPRINPRGASATWLSGAVRAEINCSSRTVPHLMRDLFKEPPTLNPSPLWGGKQGQRHHNSHRPTFVNALRRFQEKVRILWHGVLGTGISFVKNHPQTPHLTPHVIPDLVRDPGENNRQQMRSWFTPAWIPACAGMTDNIGACALPKFADQNERSFTVRPPHPWFDKLTMRLEGKVKAR